MQKLIATLTIATALGIAGPALASDHLSHAGNAPGAGNRGFDNPVTDNPSGVSGEKADPASVPGEGDPNDGNATGTPSVNLDLIGQGSGQDDQDSGQDD